MLLRLILNLAKLEFLIIFLSLSIASPFLDLFKVVLVMFVSNNVSFSFFSLIVLVLINIGSNLEFMESKTILFLFQVILIRISKVQHFIVLVK